MACLLLKTIDPTGVVRHGRARDSAKCGGTSPGSFIHHSRYFGSTLLRDAGIAGMKGEDTLLNAAGCCCAHVISLNSLVELEQYFFGKQKILLRFSVFL